MQRIAAGVVVLWIISVLLFSATYVLPGDPATRLLGNRATPETVSVLRERMGLDRSYFEQYYGWISSFLSGEIRSVVNDRPATDALIQRGANSLILATAAFVLTVAIAMSLGLVSGMRAGHAADYAFSISAFVGVSVPDFVVAGLLITVFALALELLPPVSVLSAGTTPLDRPEILVLPAVALAVPAGAWATRYVRAAVADARTAPSVEAARLAGLPALRMVFRHLLPSTLGTVSQALGTSCVHLIGGTFVVEQIFAYPGIGSMLASAVKAKDVPIILSTSIVIAAVVIVMLTVADLIGLLANPRLRRTPG